jgi:hypothetical protein
MKSDKPTNPEISPHVIGNADRAAAELNAKISLGLASKRETESLDEFTERVIQMFRDKGLFKNDRPA